MQQAGNYVGHIAESGSLVSRHCHNKEGVNYFEKADTLLIHLPIE
jgi:hypothetical protein